MWQSFYFPSAKRVVWASLGIMNKSFLLVFLFEVMKLEAARGSRAGAVVRALASHQCVPGSIPGPGVVCGCSLLFVLYSAP